MLLKCESIRDMLKPTSGLRSQMRRWARLICGTFHFRLKNLRSFGAACGNLYGGAGSRSVCATLLTAPLEGPRDLRGSACPPYRLGPPYAFPQFKCWPPGLPGESCTLLSVGRRMAWTAHYFDPRLNRDAVTRAFGSKDDALREARDLIHRKCIVHFILGPDNEKIRAVEITAWCKQHRAPRSPSAPK
jgi:hypothetical protein